MKKKFKFNWGFGIATIVVIFLLWNAIFLIFAFGEKVDLVADNYYERELKYQDEIEKYKNRNIDNGHLIIEATSSVLTVSIPEKFLTKKIEGEIYFYRPSNSDNDFKMKMVTDAEGKQHIDISNLDRGYWRIIINWNDGETKYLEQKKIII